MSKVLFVNGNLHGHINPTLPLVKELTDRGEEVYYFSTTEFKQKIEAAGAVLMDYGDTLNRFFQNYRPGGNHPFYSLIEFMLAMDRTVVPIVLEQTKDMKFDYILHDVMFGGGNILARILNIPAVSTCSSFVMDQLPIPPRMLEPGFHPQLDGFYHSFELAKMDWGMKDLTVSDLFFKKEPVNIVFTSRLFQPMGESYDDSYHFVGPSVTDRRETADFPIKPDGTGQLIYISMGTINNRLTDFYKQCIEAFREENAQVIISVGGKTDTSIFGQVPEHFVIRNAVPQLEVLQHADVILCHGGLNSVSEALYYGVPVIAIPLANDQPMVAHQLTELGAGLELKMEEVTPELLKNSVHKVLSNQSYKDSCYKVRNSFIQAGGCKKAVDIILNSGK